MWCCFISFSFVDWIILDGPQTLFNTLYSEFCLCNCLFVRIPKSEVISIFSDGHSAVLWWKRWKVLYGDNALHFSWHSPCVKLFTARPAQMLDKILKFLCPTEKSKLSPKCESLKLVHFICALHLLKIYWRWQHLECWISNLTPNPAAPIFAILLIMLTLIRQYCQVEFIWSESLELLLFLALPFFTCGLYSRSWLTGQLIYTRDVCSPIFQERFNGRYFNEAWFNWDLINFTEVSQYTPLKCCM